MTKTKNVNSEVFALSLHENGISNKFKLFVPKDSFVYDTERIFTANFCVFLYHVRNGILIPLCQVLHFV